MSTKDTSSAPWRSDRDGTIKKKRWLNTRWISRISPLACVDSRDSAESGLIIVSSFQGPSVTRMMFENQLKIC